jgi:PhzF family phenazine biosynthesis protein
MRFIERDVLTYLPTKGNRLAVVVYGDGLSDGDMQVFAAWTNLAEITFLMAPTTWGADYKVRIFTPAREMLFAAARKKASCVPFASVAANRRAG